VEEQTMSFARDVVFAEVAKHAEPVSSVVIAKALEDDLASDQVYSALRDLSTTGEIERLDRAPIPEALRKKGMPRESWTYMAAPGSSQKSVQVSELALEKPAGYHVGDPHPNAAPAPAPETQEWPGDAAARLPAYEHADRSDPTVVEIEREGYELLAQMRQAKAIQQIETLLPRAEAGVPFVGQAMPRWADVISELCRANRELLADAAIVTNPHPTQEAA
jgi:hypothetical protein